MVDGLLAINPLRKHHEFDLRSPSQRSRFRRRMEQEAHEMIAEMMYEIDTECRLRLARRCKRLSASREFVYVAMMLQDGVQPMEIVEYLRKHDTEGFARHMVTDDALRMQIERMRTLVGLKNAC